MPVLIGIESWGIGFGKTELTKAIVSRVPKARAYFENVHNKFFQPFYADVKNNVKPSVAASRMQWFHMGDRFFKHRDGMRYVWKTWKPAVFDRTIIGDHAFAFKLLHDGFLSQDDYDLYVHHRRTMEESILPHQIIIRLEGSKSTCQARLRERIAKETGRECEEDTVDGAYLDGLRDAYEAVVWPWFDQNGSKILTYDWDGDDFEAKVEKVLADIAKIVPGFSYACSEPQV